MVAYQIRAVDDKTWARLKSRAGKEGHSLRWLFLQWIIAYADGEIFPHRKD
jgi:hypothetical protein